MAQTLSAVATCLSVRSSHVVKVIRYRMQLLVVNLKQLSAASQQSAREEFLIMLNQLRKEYEDSAHPQDVTTGTRELERIYNCLLERLRPHVGTI